MDAAETLPDQTPEQEAHFYRRVLRFTVEANAAMLEKAQADGLACLLPQTQQARANLMACQACAQLTRAIRQCILLALKLTQPPRAARAESKAEPEPSERATRDSVTEPGEEHLHVERMEPLERLEGLEGLGRRPIHDLVTTLATQAGLNAPAEPTSEPPASSRPFPVQEPTGMDEEDQAREARMRHHLERYPPHRRE